jgi:hypothetical protein
MRHTILLRATLLCTLALGCTACTKDDDDGKASQVTRGERDAGTPDAGDVFDQASAQVSLSCLNAVLTESEAPGFLVKVTDAEGRVPEGNGLFVRLTPSTGTISAAKAGGAETDGNGEVSFAYVAPHFDFPTTISLEASVVGAQDRVIAREQCSFKVVTESFRFVEPERDSAVRAGRTAALTIEVLVDGVPAACDDGGGIKLTLVGPSGAGIARVDEEEFWRELCLDLTDDGRTATAQIRAGSNGGAGKLRATLGTASAELPLKFLGQVSALQLSADASELTVGSGANLSVSALDDVGQAVPGVAIELTLARCAASGCSGDEAITPESVTTDMSGKAMAAYFAGDAAGAAQITATVKTTRSISESLLIRVVEP